MGALVRDHRQLTLAIERQADLDRATALTTPFFYAPELASVLAKIKAVDGADPWSAPSPTGTTSPRRKPSPGERHPWLIWLEHGADFNRSGASGEHAAWIAGALATPDGALYWEKRGVFAAPAFRAFVDGLARTGAP
ncbi:MAG TPA: hypothetical protein VJ997_08645 [Longimicrobiales bacterium]|nr:hypothetical protein [Longimicrobiales bacterium]